MKSDVGGHIQPLVEIEQVDAAAQQDVLAVVDGLGIADFVRGRAAAQERAGFQDKDVVTGAAERDGSRKATYPCFLNPIEESSVVRVTRMLGPLIEDDSFLWMAPRIVLGPARTCRQASILTNSKPFRRRRVVYGR